MGKSPLVPHNTPTTDAGQTEERLESKISNEEHVSKTEKNKSRLDRSSKKRGFKDTNSSKQSVDIISTKEVHCSCERLDKELYQFIDEFIESQEYLDYVKYKASIIKHDEGVQYDINDLRKKPEENMNQVKKKISTSEKFRILSRKALRIFFLEKQIDKYMSNLRNIGILRNQEATIGLIREKIAEMKNVFLCHKKEREYRRIAKQQSRIEKFIHANHIDVSKMLSINRLGQVILKVDQKNRMKKRRHKNNVKKMQAQLLKDIKRNKLYLKKRKQISKETNNDERSGTLKMRKTQVTRDYISSVYFPLKEERMLNAFRKAGVCINENKTVVTELTLDKNYGTEDVSSKIDQSLQEDSVKDTSLQIPDKAYKISLDDYTKEKLGVFESLIDFENLLEARHFFCTCEKERKKNDEAELTYPEDIVFAAEPNEIKIQNYKAGKVYNKKMNLINTSVFSVRIRFFKIYVEDLDHSNCFEVCPNDMRIIHPGLSLKLMFKFRPTEDMKVVHGSLVFLTCYKSAYYKLVMKIECIPSYINISIEPQTVAFGDIPIWKFAKRYQEVNRNLNIKCLGNDYYKLIIRKIIDPLDLNISQVPFGDDEEESSSDEEERRRKQDQLDVEQILNEILQEVHSNFRLDRTFLTISEGSGEERIKVSLSNVTHPGFYIEKYRVDIYKIKEKDDEYKGMQELTFVLDVSEHFIKFDPVCVDFGICFFGTAYQKAFSVTNTSSTTQAIGINIPPSVSYYVWTKEKNMYVRSGETRKVILKLLPSCDLLKAKNKYFDPDTFILYFPIQMKLLSKQYADVPAVIQHGYAILSYSAYLILDATDVKYYGPFNEQMLLDMGKCSLNETITTQVILRNLSYSKRYFGFVNLPEYMTIMPNYGFGSIDAFQDIALNLYIHPSEKDYENEGNYAEIEEKNTIISVDNVGNLGSCRKKEDMSALLKLLRFMLKELKRLSDSDLVRNIFDAQQKIFSEMNTCTCVNTKDPSSGIQSYLEQHRLSEELEGVEYDSDGLLIRNTPNPHSGDKTGSLSQTRESLAINRSEESIQPNSFLRGENINKIQKINEDSNSTKLRRSSESKENKTEVIRTSGIVSNSLRQSSLSEREVVSLTPKEASLKIPNNSLVNLTETLSRELPLRMLFLKPLYEFSYNHIEFPTTPGASFSIMTTELRPLKNTGQKCWCGFVRKGEKARCRTTFRISGSTPEIRIEPMYGILDHGESTTLTLVASPKINDDVVADYAFDRKKSFIFREKMAAILKKRAESRSAKNKKSKAKMRKEKKEAHIQEIEVKNIQIEVTSDEVELDDADYYPAEIALWRNVEPYFIYTNFVCTVNYEIDDSPIHSPDIFPLETVCKIIAPEFIHDQKFQQVDFGNVHIGDSMKKTITIQNLTYKDMIVTSSILRPDGNFSCSNFDPVKVPGEDYLKIPITYTPTKIEEVQEYMDVRGEKTIYQFMLTAQGVLPNVRIEPSYRVIRVRVKTGKRLVIPFEIKNESDFAVKLYFQKVCEVEGQPSYLSSVKAKTLSGGKAEKKKKKDRKEEKESSKKSRSPSKKKKPCISSNELTDDEIYSLQNNCSARNENTYFNFSADSSRIALAKFSTSTAKLQFGIRAIHQQDSQTSISGLKKKRKKGVTRDDVVVGAADSGKLFIAKFNILIGSSTFLRDFIVIGEAT